MRRIATTMGGFALLSGTAIGAPLPNDGSWTPFDGATPSVLLDLPRSAEIRLVDAGTPGDRFLVTVLLGASGPTFLQVPGSEVEPDPTLNVGFDYDAAFANTAFSATVFELGAGEWELQLGTLGRVPGEGYGAIAVLLAPIPEPATIAMLMMGAVATGVQVRRCGPATKNQRKNSETGSRTGGYGFDAIVITTLPRLCPLSTRA